MPEPKYHSWLLDAASPVERRDMGAPFEQHRFEIGQTIVAAADPPAYFWFIEEAGFVSVGMPMQDGRSAEIAYIGTRGVMSIQALWTDQPLGLDFVAQQPTITFRAPIERVRSAVRRHQNLRRLFGLSTNTSLKMMAVNSACHLHHSAEQRIARRLLSMINGSELIHVTQGALADMLGTRRATVSETYGNLDAARAIRYGRGKVKVTNRATLRAYACECYDAVETLRARLHKDAK